MKPWRLPKRYYVQKGILRLRDQVWLPYFYHVRIWRVVLTLAFLIISFVLTFLMQTPVLAFSSLFFIHLFRLIEISLIFYSPQLGTEEFNEMFHRLDHHPESWETIAQWRHHFPWYKFHYRWAKSFSLPLQLTERHFFLAQVAIEKMLGEQLVIPKSPSWEIRLTHLFQKDPLFWGKHLVLMCTILSGLMGLYGIFYANLPTMMFGIVAVIFWPSLGSDFIDGFLPMTSEQKVSYTLQAESFATQLNATLPLSQHQHKLAFSYRILLEQKAYEKICEAAFLMIGNGQLVAKEEKQDIEAHTMPTSLPTPPVRRL